MKIIIAGGGTGGHLFPGIAIAEEIRNRSPENRILFIGTERGIEKRVLPDYGLDLALIDVAGIKGKGWRGAFVALAKMPRSFLQSASIIRSFCPDLVLGVGGYASGPAVLMAYLMRICTAITEQNAFPGMTNRILGHFVDRIFLAFPDEEDRFPKHKSLHTGNPIRAAFTNIPQRSPVSGRKFNLLIFGGSQGAHAINKAMISALGELAPLKGALRIIHQTGPQDLDRVRESYHNQGFDAVVYQFITDIPRFYGEADLLICRAGATSIAEITTGGRAAILIPYPYAADDHQTKNAEVLLHAGAAKMIAEQKLTGEMLAAAIRDLYANPEKVDLMAARSRMLSRPHAARQIVDACVSLIDKKGTS